MYSNRNPFNTLQEAFNTKYMNVQNVILNFEYIVLLSSFLDGRSAGGQEITGTFKSVRGCFKMDSILIMLNWARKNASRNSIDKGSLSFLLAICSRTRVLVHPKLKVADERRFNYFHRWRLKSGGVWVGIYLKNTNGTITFYKWKPFFTFP